MVEPKCPSCGVQGLDKIVSRDSMEQGGDKAPYFQIVQCNDCGHVYGVFAKQVVTPTPDHKTFLSLQSGAY